MGKRRKRCYLINIALLCEVSITMLSSTMFISHFTAQRSEFAGLASVARVPSQPAAVPGDASDSKGFSSFPDIPREVLPGVAGRQPRAERGHVGTTVKRRIRSRHTKRRR